MGSLRIDEPRLERMATHVRHEAFFLAHWTRTDLQQLYGLTAEQYADFSVAATESALLHLRVLAEFLSDVRPSPKSNHLTAADYFEDGTWANRQQWLLGGQGPDAQARHNEVMNQLHRRLAHMSLQRLEAHDWRSFNHYVPVVMRSYDTFLTDLNAGDRTRHRARWFELPHPADHHQQ